MVTFLKRFFFIHKQTKPTAQLQLRFLNQLTKLLGNGYSLIESLQIIKWDDELNHLASEVIRLLKSGVSIDRSLQQANFHETITSYLSFVQTSGDIQQHIEKCTAMYEHRVDYMKKINQMIRYPILLLVIFSILLFFINKYVLPSFANLFQTNNDMSITIMYSITIMKYLGIIALMTGLLILSTWIIWQIFKDKIDINKRINLYRSIPVYRSFMTLHTSFLFATHLSTMLKSGMTIKQILQHMSKQKNIPIISHYSSLLISEFTRGAHIDELLGQLPLIEKQFAIIFQKNNNIAALEKDLTVYADLLIEQFHRKILTAITMIQPIFFTIIALFVVFIYVTLMWPMFDLIKTF